MFGDDRLRGLGVAGGQILAFPIDIDRRPYNTLALPCECVMVGYFIIALLQIYCYVFWWKTLKIGQYLAKLYRKNIVAPFPDTV